MIHTYFSVNTVFTLMMYQDTGQPSFKSQVGAAGSGSESSRRAQSPRKFKFTNKLSHGTVIEHKSPPTPNSPTPQGPVKGRLKAQFQCILLTVKG